ncbi:hypothetical protein BCR42DRAFT_440640 [Absidia repens]|uniref:F-box domain-containing protein n=1 Tax=Absidia repens TaxID=90262 RepID=A0A1X2I8J2_9FUNG|nr:hypothetical protein BCR42DRAFT_440640 [Absidia repens]
MNPTTTTTSERLNLSHDIEDDLANLDMADHGQDEKEIIYSSLESESTEINCNNFQLDFADKNHLKRYAHEIIDYTASGIEIKHNGAILITPRFRQFPSELVSLIVRDCFEQQDLCALSLVNKQFYAIANPLLWYAPKIQDGITVENSLPPLPSASRQREELNINRDASIKYDSFRHLPCHCPNLTSVELDCGSISSTAYTELGQHCLHLRQLTLNSIDYLYSFSLGSLVSCPLQKLTLNFQLYRKDRNEDHIVRDIRQLTLLTHLKINNCNDRAGKLLIQQKSNIPPPWPRLTLLHIHSCHDTSDSDLIPFVNSHPLLTELRLMMVSSITDNSLLAIGSTLSYLTTLYLHHSQYISEDGIFKLIGKCRQLTSLTLDYCSGIALMKLELDREALENYRQGRRTSIID